jgi:hypothetical protein
VVPQIAGRSGTVDAASSRARHRLTRRAPLRVLQQRHMCRDITCGATTT